jgi:tRNA dimethylallyltransferase
VLPSWIDYFFAASNLSVADMNEKPSCKADVFCLMGPTASGKTALAVELVTRLPFEIISVDSAQIYRGMDIGTGKPDAATLARAPHRLIDIRDPSQAYSAAEFRNDAINAIQDVLAQNHIPLLVGGTMLYFKVLRDGLAEMPVAHPQIREDIEELAASQGWDAVHRKLAAIDPQRLQRALEIYLVSGRSMTQLHREANATADHEKGLPFTLHFLAIEPEDRSNLHEIIARRFLKMLVEGFVEEVEALLKKGEIDASCPSMRSVGYRQVWDYLAGEIPYDAMVERGIIATRQLAKRQITWLRSWDNLSRLGTEREESLASVLKLVQSVTI